LVGWLVGHSASRGSSAVAEPLVLFKLCDEYIAHVTYFNMEVCNLVPNIIKSL